MSLGKVSWLAIFGWALAASLSCESLATVFLHDQFQVDGGLATMVPSPGPGAAWNPGSATGVNAVTVTNGEVVLVQTDGGTNGEDIANIFADVAADATTFARFDFRLPSVGNETLATDVDVSDEGVFFVTLRGSSASTSQRGRFGILNPTAGGDFRIAINADNSNLAMGGIWEADLDFDTSYRSIISYNAATGESKLWLNPVNESSASVSHTGSSGTVINRIILRQAIDYAGRQFIDNVVIASSFAEALNPISVVALLGDYNNNTVVDAADYTVWRDNLGSNFNLNGNGDEIGDSMGVVDGADYELWKLHFGDSNLGGGALALVAVPEPTAAAILLWGIALAARLRHARLPNYGQVS